PASPPETRIRATEGDLSGQPLYRPDISLDDLRAHGVLDARPAATEAPTPRTRTYGHGQTGAASG
ncbi:hypothetical protein ACWDRB_67785, partial [Nonomuraea sp. NPDC003707]